MRDTVNPLTKRCNDYSDKDRFCFSFFCDRCGAKWSSETMEFNRAGFTEINNEQIECRIWNEEHRIAFERANLEASFHFNYCPSCGRWVCDECFWAVKGSRADVCCDCFLDP